MNLLLVATFKSNKTAAQVNAWLAQVEPVAAKSSQIIAVAPSYPYLSIVKSQSSLNLAAQDVSPFPAGSYTGAVNASQLQDMGVKYCIVGHSERRHYFHETVGEVAGKVRELISVGITPIVCVDQGDIAAQCASLESDIRSKVIFCYEPAAAIGGVESAPGSNIAKVVARIRDLCDQPVRVMYGGAVNKVTFQDIQKNGAVDGVLVSSASLDAAHFCEIIALAE